MKLPSVLLRRKLDSHKGDYGHLLVIGGSPGLTGAVALCSLSALRAGAGLVTLGIPEGLNFILELKLTEVMTKPLAETKEKTISPEALPQILEFSKKIDAFAIGPGLSTQKETADFLLNLLPRINKPTILDADGLNILAKDISVLKKVRVPFILSPHPGEMARLVKKPISEIQKNRKEIARDFAAEYRVVLVLKGPKTIVTDQKNTYINHTGNPGMATAGSGDVLTGIIGALLAQGLSSFEAAKFGVYLHGLAGDLAAQDKGEISLIAGDILEKLPEAFLGGRSSFA